MNSANSVDLYQEVLFARVTSITTSVGLQTVRFGVRSSPGSMCCFLEQETFTPKIIGNTQEKMTPSPYD